MYCSTKSSSSKHFLVNLCLPYLFYILLLWVRSLIMGESKLCKYRLRHNNVKLSLEVASTLTVISIRRPHSGQHFLINTWLSVTGLVSAIILAFDQRDLQHPVRHGSTTYALGRVTTFWGGLSSAWFLCIRKLCQSVFQLYVRPDTLARSHGAFGCLCGLVLFPFYLIGYVLKSFVIWLDRFSTGVANGCFHQDMLFVFDPSVQARVYSSSAELDDILKFERPGEKRVCDIDRAMELALAANKIFKECHPCFPPDHWHWKVAETKKLKEIVNSVTSQSALGLSDSEYATLKQRMDACNLEKISFSRFCLFIADAVQARFSKVDIDVENSSRLMSYANNYGHLLVDGSFVGENENDHEVEFSSIPFMPSDSLRRSIVRRMSLPTFRIGGKRS